MRNQLTAAAPELDPATCGCDCPAGPLNVTGVDHCPVTGDRCAVAISVPAVFHTASNPNRPSATIAGTASPLPEPSHTPARPAALLDDNASADPAAPQIPATSTSRTKPRRTSDTVLAPWLWRAISVE